MRTHVLQHEAEPPCAATFALLASPDPQPGATRTHVLRCEAEGVLHVAQWTVALDLLESREPQLEMTRMHVLRHQAERARAEHSGH